MEDPVERTLIRSLVLICAALTAMAFLALTQSCTARKTAMATSVATDTARVESSRSWQRMAESVAGWEADSIVVSDERRVVSDTFASDINVGSKRITIYRPRATSQSSLAESSTDTLSVTTASKVETATETTRSTTPPLWPCLAAAAVVLLLVWGVKRYTS